MGKEGIQYLEVRKIENKIVLQSKKERIWLSDILDQYHNHQVKNCLIDDDAEHRYSKEQVVMIVAQFARTYDTERLLSGYESLDESIKEVSELIDWGIVDTEQKRKPRY